MAQGRVPGLSGVSSLRTAHAHRPDQPALLGGLLALAVVAWLVTGDRMGSMESMPGMALGGLGFYVTVWVVMMAAMMFPSVAPTVLMYDRLRAENLGRGDRAPVDATALFVCGYLLVWTAAGLVAYALFELVRALDPAFLAWDEAGRYVTAGVIVAAAAYQLTPAKETCLAECRNPTTVLAERWRDGRAGAIELGIRYGAWCLGCCWALMAALFAVGVMSLGWMAVDRGVHRGREAAAVADRGPEGLWPCRCSCLGWAWRPSRLTSRGSPSRTARCTGATAMASPCR